MLIINMIKLIYFCSSQGCKSQTGRYFPHYDNNSNQELVET